MRYQTQSNSQTDKVEWWLPGWTGGDWDKMGKRSCCLMIIKEVKEFQVCKMKCFEDNSKTM